MHPDSSHQPRIDARVGFIDVPPAGRNETNGELSSLVFRQGRSGRSNYPRTAIEPHLTRASHEDVGNRGIDNKSAQTTERGAPIARRRRSTGIGVCNS